MPRSTSSRQTQGPAKKGAPPPSYKVVRFTRATVTVRLFKDELTLEEARRLSQEGKVRLVAYLTDNRRVEVSLTRDCRTGAPVGVVSVAINSPSEQDDQ